MRLDRVRGDEAAPRAALDEALRFAPGDANVLRRRRQQGVPKRSRFTLLAPPGAWD